MSAAPVRATVRELAFEGVWLQFGGLTALRDVRFTVEPRALHAVVGPNGAGKTSLLNVVSGLYRASFGVARYGDRMTSLLNPHELAAMGIGRTFQDITLDPASTVRDNVMLGRHGLGKGGFLAGALGLNRGSERRHGERVIEICDFLGITGGLDMLVGTLPLIVLRRVEIARALAVEPGLLLLDEPTAGFAANEAAELAVTIRQLRDALDISVLVAERDFGAVVDAADRVTVLSLGEVVADGKPDRVRADPEVRRAYVGVGASDEASQP